VAVGLEPSADVTALARRSPAFVTPVCANSITAQSAIAKIPLYLIPDHLRFDAHRVH
jgi:hypothetical protein